MLVHFGTGREALRNRTSMGVVGLVVPPVVVSEQSQSSRAPGMSLGCCTRWSGGGREDCSCDFCCVGRGNAAQNCVGRAPTVLSCRSARRNHIRNPLHFSFLPKNFRQKKNAKKRIYEEQKRIFLRKILRISSQKHLTKKIRSKARRSKDDVQGII